MVLLNLIFSRGGLLVIALTAAWFWHTSEIADAIEAHDNAATAKRREAVSEFVVDMSAANSKLRNELALERSREKANTVTLLKEVTRYVTPLADSKCIVPAGFVHHYNAAWGLSALSGSAIGLVDQPSGIPLSAVESVNTDNAGAAKEWRAEALSWRRWYTVNKTKYNAFAGTTDPRAAAGKSSAVPANPERKLSNENRP